MKFTDLTMWVHSIDCKLYLDYLAFSNCSYVKNDFIFMVKYM